MFNAKGLGVIKLPAGQFQVQVGFYTDAEPDKVILREQYVVVDRPTLVTLVAAQLQQLKAAADDAAQNMNIVGKPLGSI